MLKYRANVIIVQEDSKILVYIVRILLCVTYWFATESIFLFQGKLSSVLQHAITIRSSVISSRTATSKRCHRASPTIPPSHINLFSLSRFYVSRFPSVASRYADIQLMYKKPLAYTILPQSSTLIGDS